MPDVAAAERGSVLRLLRWLATAGSALMLVVIVSSAYLRLAQVAPPCVDGVDCPTVVRTPDRAARLAHRIAASAAAAVLLALLFVAAAQRPMLKRQTAIAGVGLLVAAGLAIIGARSSGAGITPQPGVTLANLAGGFTLFALTWWLRLTTWPKKTESTRRSIRAFAILALLAAIADVLVGAMASAGFSSRMSLDTAHWLCATVVLAFVVAVVLVPRHANPEIGRASLVAVSLVLLDVALGVLATLTSSPLAVVLAHNVVAALLVAALVGLNELLVPGLAPIASAQH